MLPIWAWIIIGASCLKLLWFILFCFRETDLYLLLFRYFGKSAKSLAGKVIWITGSSSGIGAGLAIELAKNGVKLVLTATRKEQLEEMKVKCLEASKGRLTHQDVFVLPMDLANLSTHQEGFDAVLDHFGRLDVLVNNAGRGHLSYGHETSMEVTVSNFQLNVFAVLNLTNIAVNHWISKDQPGHIVVTSSIAGLIPFPLASSYAATKHALHGYFESVRLELFTKKIKISMVCPGPVSTGIYDRNVGGIAGEKATLELNPPNQMSAERCGKHYAVAIANQTTESWIVSQPSLFSVYFTTGFPTFTRNVVPPIMNKKRLEAMVAGR